MCGPPATRPAIEEWRAEVSRRPVDGDVRHYVGLYDRAHDEARRAGTLRWASAPPARPRTAPPSPERPRASSREAPTYPPREGSQANARGRDDSREPTPRGSDLDDHRARRGDDWERGRGPRRDDPRWPRQSSESCPYYQTAEAGHHDGTERRHRPHEAAATRARERSRGPPTDWYQEARRHEESERYRYFDPLPEYRTPRPAVTRSPPRPVVPRSRLSAVPEAAHPPAAQTPVFPPGFDLARLARQVDLAMTEGS